MAKLLFRDGQGREGAVDLTGEPVYVGRAVECVVRTDDAMVSRRHSVVTLEQGRFWIEDLGSSNGTHVNDLVVKKQVLNHNDVIRCGSLFLRYIEEEMPAEPPARPEAKPQPKARPPAPAQVAPVDGVGDPGYQGALDTVLPKAAHEKQMKELAAELQEARAEVSRMRAVLKDLQKVLIRALKED